MNILSRVKEHPTGFWFIFWAEIAERTSLYGMRAVLALYLTTVLQFKQEDGAAIMHAFIAACYLTPLLGGFLADRILGRYKTILYFSGPYILGHLILGGIGSRTGLFIALALLALGSGSIKPNAATLMGQMYEEQKRSALRTAAFSYYFAAINIGSAIGTLSLPKVRDHFAATSTIEHGYAVALTIPAVLMTLAFVLFALGKKHYPRENVKDLPPKTTDQRAAERATLARIAGIFAVLTVVWLVADQSASTWIYFAADHMDLRLFGNISITPDQIQGINPVLIIALTPVFNTLWELLRARRGEEVPDTRKMLFGFILIVICMAIMAAAGFAAGAGKVTVWWLCLATFVITLAELCIAVVGLELAFKVALPGTKSVVTATFLLAVFGGQILAGIFDKLLWNKISPGLFFAIQTAIMAAAALLFFAVARRFEQSSAAPNTSLPGQ